MLIDLCRELKNWFDRDQPHLHGAFEIRDGHIVDTDFNQIIKTNQYYRICGSIFNDGIYKYGSETDLIDEAFVGSVTLMAIPRDFIALSEEIDAWNNKYGGVDSEAMSPFASESFGGYSYTKGSGSNGSSGNGAVTWQSAFASKLNKWRKI